MPTMSVKHLAVRLLVVLTFRVHQCDIDETLILETAQLMQSLGLTVNASPEINLPCRLTLTFDL